MNRATFYGSGNSRTPYWNTQRILDTFGEKIALWISKDDELTDYYVNKIGVQDRQALTEGAISGVIHAGRAISYDGAKSQYSRTIGNAPANFKLFNNSITVFFRIRQASAPTAQTVVLNYASNTNGFWHISILNTGKIQVNINHTSAISKSSDDSICDDLWHDVFVLINKAGNFALFVDNVIQGTVTDISALSFNDYTAEFYVGGQPFYYSDKIKHLRDIRIFSSAITSEEDRDTIHDGGYVAGCAAWWFCEEGKDGLIYLIKDSVGTNHLNNFAFDGTSLVTGTWLSLFNKFGYSASEYNGADLILGDGEFDVSTEWTFTATRFAVTGGQAWFKAVDSLVPTLMCNRAISYATTDVLKISFDITSGSAKIAYFMNQGSQTIGGGGTYATGHHDVILRPTYAGTKIGISADYTGGAFYMDNLTIRIYEASFIAPLMNAAIPTTDTLNRSLTFKDQAKYNLQKVSETVVNLPDYVGEIFDACELITIDDWYDAAGVGNEIALVDIDAYQTKRQYYKNEELIIIKADAVLTDAEDIILKKKLKLGSETYTPIYNVDVAIGTLTGTTAQIYAMAQAIIDSDPVSSVQAVTPVESGLDPSNNFIALGWADFFDVDALYTLPLIAKYNPLGFANTFYFPIIPLSDDYRNPDEVYRDKLKMIEESGSWNAAHSLYQHIPYLSSLPTYDGRTTPSNDDLRVSRADGTNELGHDIDETVDTSITTTIRESWLRLSAAIGAKAWKDLTDADCMAFRKSMSAFMMTFDNKVLEGMDYLSNRYCNTIGVSVYNNDYITRTPNTVDGLEPSVINPIIGGIFTGASTTQNHEIWERLVIIEKAYREEFEGKINASYFWSSAGGNSNALYYNIESPPDIYGRYTDKTHSDLACGAVKYTSSITGTSRTFIEVLQNAGFICTMNAQGDGYSQYAYDKLVRLEGQRTFKKNGLKKPDNVGDGFENAMRCWDATIPALDQATLLGTADLVKELYDYTYTNIGSYPANTEYTAPAAFCKVLDTLTKFNAWGLVPDFVADSGTTGAGISSYIMALEALYQFCKRAGITVISHEQACLMGMTKTLPVGYNYFPNNTLATTVKTITDAVNAVVVPDGWNGGVVISEDTGAGAVNVLHIAADGTIFTRQYAIKPATLNLSFKAKGIGTLKIRKILNKNTFNSTSGAAFTEINSITINSAGGYTEYTAEVEIPDAAMEVYSAPATPAEEAYQNYMKGYGDKICGIQIELVIAGGNYVKMGNCSLTE